MTDEPDNPTRFESLAARFFDGELEEAEDRELAGLLEGDPALGRRFIEMARMDRAIAGLASSRRVSDEAFEAAVRRSLTIDTDDESRRFADEVVELVRSGSERRRTRRLSALPQRQTADAALFAAATAACVAIALLGFFFISGGPARVATQNPKPVANPDLSPGDSPPIQRPIQPRHDPLAQNESPRLAPEPTVAVQAPKETRSPDPEESAAPPTQSTPTESVASTPPAPFPAQMQSPSDLPAKVLARLERLTHATAAISHGAANAEARTGVACAEGDTLRIVAAGSPGDAHAANDGADVVLADGSRIWLAPGSEFRFHSENESACPTLINGELLARIQPQKPGHPLRIRTQQGPVVEVVGTVFRLAAEASRKRVSLRVDEGKVLFSNQGVERRVTADEFCESEDGHAPGQVGRLRPGAASVAGLVLDKTSGKPLANALITVVPQARRVGEKQLGQFPHVRTDAQGRYKFDAVREGLCFVLVEADGGTGAVHYGLARAKLGAGEDVVVNISAEKPALVIGAVEDSSKHVLIGDAHVRFLADGGDSQTLTPALAPAETHDGMQLGAMVEYRCAVVEGAGKFAPAVEKPGLLIKVRTPRNVQLVTDRVNQWMLDVQIGSSAAVKGRVLDSVSSNPLIDDPALDSNDPRQSRTLLTLTPAGGAPHSLCAEADGSFVFNTNLDAGAYELKAQRFGFAPATKRITLAAGQAIDCDMPLEPLHARK